MKSLLPILFSFIFLVSCNEYQQVLKKTDVKAKYDLAEKYYNEGDYKRASRLFEQVVPKYVGKPQGERVIFFLADTYYKTRNYYLASFQFERFVKSYPNSDKLQEAIFLGAKSSYEISPKYSLDQTETDKALNKLQSFINSYPDSEYFAEANILAQELNNKKEKKQIEIAKQFDKIGEFNLPILVSAIAALDNFIADNPGSEYREEAFYYKMKAASNLAFNSTSIRKGDRLDEAMDAYKALKKSYPDTKFDKKASSIYKSMEKELASLNKKTK